MTDTTTATPTPTTTWRELYQAASSRLGSRAEARWLIEELAQDARAAFDETPVPGTARERFEALIQRRVEGEPIQYVLGRWGFRKLDLLVDRRVLIPRPETEQVVEVAVALLSSNNQTVVDLGTGSGAIALAIASERPGAQVWATDLYPEALTLAQANMAGIASDAAGRVRLAQGDWWAALPSHLMGRVDLAVSNPPYISSHEMCNLDVEVRCWEPSTALEAGPQGTEAIEEIVNGAPTWLAPHGALVVEIAPHQAEAASALARSAGFGQIDIHRDLADRDRVLVAVGLR